MCNNDVICETEKVVNEFIDKWEAFTALDVSNKVKETLPQIRHREVAPVVHDIMIDRCINDDYCESQIDVTAENGNVITARLYHPVWDDNLDLIYPSHKRQQKPIPPRAPNVPLATPVVDTTANPMVAAPVPVETVVLDYMKNEPNGVFASDIRHYVMLKDNLLPRTTQDAINNLLNDKKIEADADGKLHISSSNTNQSPVTDAKLPDPIAVPVNDPVSLTGSVKTIAAGAVKVFRGFLQR